MRLPWLVVVLGLSLVLHAACGGGGGGGGGSGGCVVATVEITPIAPSGNIGGTVQFTAVARNAAGAVCGSVTFNWSSSDNTIVIVDSSGLATLLFSGDPADYPANITITATAAGTAINGQETLTVTNPVDHVEVTPDPASMTTCVDPPLQFTAVAEDSSDVALVPQPPMFWNSSNTAAATISGSGLATAVAAGVTQITATAYGIPSPDVLLTVSGGATITVTVTPNPLTLPAGGDDDTFDAVVAGFVSDDTVTWSVDGGAANGTIELIAPGPNTAEYHAPPFVPVPDTVTVRATSNENTNCSGTADVTIIPTFGAANEFGLGGNQNPQSLVIGHFNLNTDLVNLDVAVANQDSDSVAVLLGDGAGSLAFTSAVSTTDNDPVSLAQGMFDGDTRPDLAAVNFADDSVAPLLGNGDGTFSPAAPPTLGVGVSPQSVAAGDFDNPADGFDDLAVANFFSEDITVLRSNGDGTFTESDTISLAGSGPWAVVAGFLDGDGSRDLAVADLTGDAVWILLGNGDGTFTVNTSTTVAGGPAALAIADFDGTFADLVVVNRGSGGDSCPPPADPDDNQVTILLGLGDGTFPGPGVTYPVGSNPRSVAPGDFDQDGAVDLVVANYCDDTASLLFGNGDGTFQSTASYFLGTPGSNRPTGVAVGDLNNDTFDDVAVSNSGTDSVSVLLNNN
jgi:hypothetical protein